jgi:hypothetical protein
LTSPNPASPPGVSRALMLEYDLGYRSAGGVRLTKTPALR